MSAAALVAALLARNLARVEAATAALAAAGPSASDGALLERAARLVRVLERSVAARRGALGLGAAVYRDRAPRAEPKPPS